MPLNKQELMGTLNELVSSTKLKKDSEYMTRKTLGGYLKGSSQDIQIAHDAVGEAIETILIKIQGDAFNYVEGESSTHYKHRMQKYLYLSIKSYLVDRARRWGSNIKTNAPAARARLEPSDDIIESDFFDIIQNDIHARSNESLFRQWLLEELIDRANLTDDEKWIVEIRTSDLKQSECHKRFITLTFAEIAQIFDGKADTYEKRYKRAVSKLKDVSEMVS